MLEWFTSGCAETDADGTLVAGGSVEPLMEELVLKVVGVALDTVGEGIRRVVAEGDDKREEDSDVDGCREGEVEVTPVECEETDKAPMVGDIFPGVGVDSVGRVEGVTFTMLWGEG